MSSPLRNLKPHWPLRVRNGRAEFLELDEGNAVSEHSEETENQHTTEGSTFQLQIKAFVIGIIMKSAGT